MRRLPMAWWWGVGAIDSGGKSPLIPCSGGAVLLEDLEVMRGAGVVEACDFVLGNWKGFLRHDGAATHKAGLTLASLSE
jgi:hypothetical protein